MADTPATQKNSFIANVNLLVLKLQTLIELNSKFTTGNIDNINELHDHLDVLLYLRDNMDLIQDLADTVPELQNIKDVIDNLPNQINDMIAEVQALVDEAHQESENFQASVTAVQEYWQNIEDNLLPQLDAIKGVFASVNVWDITTTFAINAGGYLQVPAYNYEWSSIILTINGLHSQRFTKVAPVDASSDYSQYLVMLDTLPVGSVIEGITFTTPDATQIPAAVTHDTTLVGDGSIEVPLGVNTSILSDIASNNTQIGALQGRVTTLESDNVTNKGNIAAVTTRNNTQDNRLTSLETTSAALVTDNTTNKNNIITLQTKDVGHDTSINNLSNSLITMGGSISSNTSRITVLEGKANTATTAITDLTSRTTANETAISGLNTRTTTLESSSASLDGRVSTLEDRADDTDITTATHTTQIANLVTKTDATNTLLNTTVTNQNANSGLITTQGNRITALESGLTTTNTNLANTSDSLDDLTTLVATLPTATTVTDIVNANTPTHVYVSNASVSSTATAGTLLVNTLSNKGVTGSVTHDMPMANTSVSGFMSTAQVNQLNSIQETINDLTNVPKVITDNTLASDADQTTLTDSWTNAAVGDLIDGSTIENYSLSLRWVYRGTTWMGPYNYNVTPIANSYQLGVVLSVDDTASNNGSINVDVNGTMKTIGYAAMATTVADLLNRVTALETALAAAQANITTLQGNISDAQTGITGLGTRMSAAESGITATGAGLSAVQVNLNTLTQTGGTIDALNTRVTAVEQVGGTNATDITALETKTDTTNIDLTALTTRVTNAEPKITANTAGVAALVTKTDTTNDNVTAVTARVTSVEATVSGHTADIGTLRDELNTNNADTAGLGIRMTAAEGNITTNTGDITVLETRCSTIETTATTLAGTVGTNVTNITNLTGRVEDLEEAVEVLQDQTELSAKVWTSNIQLTSPYIAGTNITVPTYVLGESALEVFINGIRTDQFTEVDATTISLPNGMQSNDTIQVTVDYFRP